MKNYVKINRQIRGYSQQQLADLVNVSRQTINALEASKYVPSTILALKVATVLGLKIEELFELEEGD